MLKQFLVIAFASMTLAAAPTTRPYTPVEIARDPAIQHDLLKQAVEFMRNGDFAKAADPMEKVYDAVAPDARSRALVLNHAIFDFTQKRLVMRALRDLTTYLTKHRNADEQATNILGAALNLVAENPKLKKGELWQSAYKEWDRRNYILDHSREGWHRWGVRWINQQEYDAIQQKKAALDEAIRIQADRLNRAAIGINSLLQQQQNAADTQAAYDKVRQFLYQQYPGVNYPQTASGINAGEQVDARFVQKEAEAYASAMEIGGRIQTAFAELQAEQNQMKDLQAQKAAIRPQWPSEFATIDPDAPFSDVASTQPLVPPVSPKAAVQPDSPNQLYPAPKK